MKFSCDRCGKRYATADRPTPGRIYKLRCKACGHLIVVSVPAFGAESVEEPTPTSAPLAPGADGPPGANLADGGAAPDAPSSPGGAPPDAFDPTRWAADAPRVGSVVDEASSGAEPPREERPADALTPPPRELGYVDLFSDLREPSAPEPGDDRFLSPGGGPLPAGAATIAPADPFGPPGDPRPESTPGRALSAAAKVPAIPRPPQQRSSLPLVMMGLGVLALAGILAFVMLSAGTRAPSAEPGVAAATAPQAIRPPEAPVIPAEAPPRLEVAQPAPPEVPVAKEAADAAEAARLAEDAARREREAAARAEKARLGREAKERAAREAKERERIAREQKAAREREAKERAARERQERARLAAASAPAEPPPLTPTQIDEVLRATRPALDACLAGSDVKLDGRRVTLRLNIQPTGAVTYPTLDDVTLNGTQLGSCLKGAARRMVFPRFGGETVHVEVPFALRRG